MSSLGQASSGDCGSYENKLCLLAVRVACAILGWGHRGSDFPSVSSSNSYGTHWIALSIDLSVASGLDLAQPE
ncbi:hypothetical protein AOLI_G00094600 [Acnodon oligacanthus]